MTDDRTPARALAAVAWLLWATLVVYGSLVPFAFTPRPLSEALAAFLAIPMYSIGPAGRADWLANLLLYVPLAFLGSWVCDSPSRPLRVAGIFFVSIACGLIAVAIEFAQLYFPPRTVSLNDLVAEALGIALGTLAWLTLRRRIFNWAAQIRAGGSAAAHVLMLAYVVLYVALALIPFDFLLSPAEFATKNTALQTGWWTAPSGCTRFFPCTLQLVMEALIAVPLGIAAVTWRGGGLSASRLIAGGLLLGAGIETAQLLLASGVTQGASVLAKAAGFVAGGMLAPRGVAGLRRMRAWRRLPYLVGLLAVLYMLLLTVLLQFWRGDGVGWTAAAARIPAIIWMPFYYYYYTSETRALVSVLVQAALFMPLGALLACGCRTLPPGLATTIAGLLAGVLAFVAQALRLLHPPQRPDVTDVLIAIVAAIVGYLVCRFLLRLLDDDVAPHSNGPMKIPRRTHEMHATAPSAPDRGHHEASATSEALSDAMAFPPVAKPSWLLRASAVTLAVFLAWSWWDYPLDRSALGILLVAYAALIVRWPNAWYAVLPALLPVADLAGWSGRLFFSEFDRLVLVTLIVACWRAAPPTRSPVPRHFPVALLALVAGSVLLSLVRGLWPLPDLDANALTTYTGHFNALRIAKGLGWAVLLCWIARRDALAAARRSRLFAYGMAGGAAAVIAVVAWERFVFTGLFNFAHEYRVTGPFWEMNTGGAYIEGYLVATLPFVIYVLVAEHRVVLRLSALGIFVGGIYAVLVTMSRNGFAALAAAMGVLCVGLATYYGRARRMGVKGVLGAIVLVAVVGVVAVPVLTGATLKGRFATVAEDFRTRIDHWTLALDLRGSSAVNEWLGVGLGRFPDVYFWGSGRTRPSSYRFMDEGTKRFVRLGGGESLYFEQFVAVDPDTRYTIEVSLRTNVAHATFTIPVCEKWMLSSFACAWQSIDLQGPEANFSTHTLTIESGAMARGTWYMRRPVRIALYNATHDSAIDVTNVRLVGPDGLDRVANGDFTRGMDHWHFSTDSHLPWHVKSLPVQILFDYGWFGMVAWGALVLFALARGAAGMWRGDLFAAAAVAGLMGFLVVGLFDSMIDTPRLLLLFGLLLWLAAAPRSEDGVDNRIQPGASG